MANEEIVSRSDIQTLLANLKLTVEGILATGSRNVWNMYGGLSRLSCAMEDILYHHIKPIQNVFGTSVDYWPFVRGLQWLQPTSAPFLERISRMSETAELTCGRVWLELSLQDHNLSGQLTSLVSSNVHVAKFYTEEAFVRHPAYVHAMCLCLRAVEHNDVTSLTDINLSLISGQYRFSCQQQVSSPHEAVNDKRRKEKTSTLRRELSVNSSDGSFPGASPLSEGDLSAIPSIRSDSESASENDRLLGSNYDLPAEPIEDHPLIGNDANNSSGDVSPTYFDELSIATEKPRFIVDDKSLKTDEMLTGNDETYKPRVNSWQNLATDSPVRGHRRVKSDQVVTVKSVANGSRATTLKNDISFDASFADSSSTPRSSTMSSLNVDSGYKDSWYLPKPAAGQSLRSYLSSQDFHTCANLDKENAHFSISEALIAAIEQMKSNHLLPKRNSPARVDENSESDEEIQHLQQRIRIRKREKLKEREHGEYTRGRIHNNSTNTSLSSPVSSHLTSIYSSLSDQSSDSDDVDFEISNSQKSNLTKLKDSGLSLSMASLYSDADLQRNTAIAEKQSSPVTTAVTVSAETVAMSLLKKYSEKQLPKASDLEWLVSEQDAPQALLPLPNSYPVSPDDGEIADLILSTKMPRIRGNLQWAPPRPQIIFNIHPPPKRSVIVARQNHRCAGCGMKIEPGFMKRLRYCDYIGKYFCPCCHGNALAYIPARVIHKWDWTKHRVSNFAHDVLRTLADEPHFNVVDLNPGLVKKVRVLEKIHECRVQLHHLSKFIHICKSTEVLRSTLHKLPIHWLDEEWMFSLDDLYKTRTGDMLSTVRSLVLACVTHVKHCGMCSSQGFICELCKDEGDIIYPFELSKVHNCPACKACYHLRCYKDGRCPRCDRIQSRKRCVKVDDEFGEKSKARIISTDTASPNQSRQIPKSSLNDLSESQRASSVKIDTNADVLNDHAGRLTNEMSTPSHMTRHNRNLGDDVFEKSADNDNPPRSKNQTRTSVVRNMKYMSDGRRNLDKSIEIDELYSPGIRYDPCERHNGGAGHQGGQPGAFIVDDRSLGERESDFVDNTMNDSTVT